MIKGIVIISCLLLAISGAHLKALGKKIPMVENLKISNYTGSSITAQMVAIYVKTINEAFTFYQEDFPSTTLFIQNRLEGSYDGYFDVIILK